MLITLYSLGIIIGLIRRNDVFVRVYQFFIIWILFAFNTQNVDIENYKRIYEDYYLGNGEPGFIVWRHLFSDRGVPFELFWITSYTIVLLIVFISIWRLFEEKDNGAIALLMIYPLLGMVTPFRNTMSNAIIIAALSWYLKTNVNKPCNKIKYGMLILIAASFHYSALFFLIFLLIGEETPSNKSIVRMVEIMIFSTVILNSPVFFNTLYTLFHTERVLSWFESSNRIGLGFALVCGMHIVGFLIASYSNRWPRITSQKASVSDLSVSRKIYSANVYSMFLVGFYTYNMEFFSRVYCVMIIINCLNSFYLLNVFRKNRYAVAGCIIQALYIMLLFVYFYYGERFGVISVLFLNNAVL